MPHKLFIDSRAAKQGEPGDFVWSPDRPISVNKCRAFIDAVHMANTWGTITANNQFMYLAEELPLVTVLPTATKIYLRETDNGITTDRIVVIPPAIYDGATFSTALATALGPAYATTYVALPPNGRVDITSTITTWTILSRASLLRDGTFNGSKLLKSSLEDASDLLRTVDTDITGPNNVILLAHGLAYRKIQLAIGSYTFDTLATEMATQLNVGTTFDTDYIVTKNVATGRLSVVNSEGVMKFYIYPSQFLDINPYAFQGYIGPFYNCDDATGLTGRIVIEGNSIIAANHINSLAFHTLFINSSLGSHTDTVGPLSQTTIARKVTVDVPPGHMIHDYHSTQLDYIGLEKQSISAISFKVTDWRGNAVVMSHWSLSLILIEEDQF
jgi:hypothetical protein